MAKKENEQKKELARLYYMQGDTQKQIAIRLNVSEVTVSKWSNDGRWQIKRAAVNITRPELVNKNLLLINSLLDKLNDCEDPTEEAGKIADTISKLASTIEKIDKKTNLVTVMEVCSSFEKWLVLRSNFDKNVTNEFIDKVNEYQQYYIDDFDAIDKS
jgi:transcriptional regulator with XRE-family HTH domain